jgi:outer membrane protein
MTACTIPTTFRIISFVKKYSKLLVAVLAISGSSLICVQPVHPEDLMEVYSLALQADPAFQAESYRHDASAEGYKQAMAELYPQISGDYYYKRVSQQLYNSDIAVYGVDKTSYPSRGYGLTLTQPVFEYSSIVGLKQAKEEVKGADYQLASAGQELILRVAEAYIEVLKAKDGFEFAKAEEEALTQHYKLAKERYSNGLATITDFYDAKASLASVSAKRTIAEKELDDAREGLVAIVGKRVSEIKELKKIKVSSNAKDSKSASTLVEQSNLTGNEMPLINPDPDSADKWEDAAGTQNLKVKVMEQKFLAAEKEVKKQNAGHYPTVNLVGKYDRDNEGGSLFGGKSDLGTREVMLQLNVPIFQGGAVSSRVREAKKLAEAAKQDLEKQARLAKREARAAFMGVKSAISNTDALMQSMISFQIALESKKEGFKSGLFPSLSIADAEKDLYSAKKDYSRSYYEYMLNSLRLKNAVGTLSPQDLEGINGWLE